MEELQSTEVLDREILEDARKKAYRILKTAEESMKTGVATWEKKGDADLAEVRQRYAERVLEMRKELAARLVLDKRRVRSEKIETLLKSAMETYLRGLKRETLLSILEGTLQKQLESLRESGAEACMESGVKVQYHKVEAVELEAMLNRNLPKGSWTISSGNAGFIQEEPFPKIVLDAPEVQISASIVMVAETLLEDKRAELIQALLGAGALSSGGVV
jgi:vacuolar-type H+-ATPase subunit E/Vma4